MRMLVGCVTAFLTIVWALLWRRVWLEEARRRDAVRIRPLRVIPGMEKADEALRDRTARRREADEAARAEFIRQRRSGKPRLHRAS